MANQLGQLVASYYQPNMRSQRIGSGYEPMRQLQNYIAQGAGGGYGYNKPGVETPVPEGGWRLEGGPAAGPAAGPALPPIFETQEPSLVAQPTPEEVAAATPPTTAWATDLQGNLLADQFAPQGEQGGGIDPFAQPGGRPSTVGQFAGGFGTSAGSGGSISQDGTGVGVTRPGGRPRQQTQQEQLAAIAEANRRRDEQARRAEEQRRREEEAERERQRRRTGAGTRAPQSQGGGAGSRAPNAGAPRSEWVNPRTGR